MRIDRIRMNPRLALVGGLALLAAACGAPEEPPAAMDAPEETAAAGPPTFTYDPSWPKPLPNNWALGDVWGVAVDSNDNPWIAHADSDRIQELLAAEGKELAPPVIQFDQEGNLLQAWGGPGEGYEWMVDTFAAEHGMFIDHDDNVWVIGGGTRADGGVVLKFTRGRRVPAPDRQEREDQRQPRRGIARRTDHRRGPSGHQRGVRGRRLHEPTRHRVRRRHRRVQAPLGRLRAAARRRPRRGALARRPGAAALGPDALRAGRA